MHVFSRFRFLAQHCFRGVVMDKNAGVRAAVAFCLLAVSAVVAGCGGGDGTTQTQTITSPIMGSWHRVQIADETQVVSCPGSFPTTGSASISCGEDDTYFFRPDGTFLRNLLGDIRSGTYSIGDGTLRLTINSTQSALAVNFDGQNTMTFQYSEGDRQFREIFERQ